MLEAGIEGIKKRNMEKHLADTKKTRVLAIVALVVILATAVLVSINMGLVINTILIVCSFALLQVYAYRHLNSKRLNLWQHEQGYKLTKLQQKIISAIEYSLPIKIFGINIILGAILTWCIRLSPVIAVILLILYLNK
jgi:hypothetical protein